MSLMSWTFPKGSIDLGKKVSRLPADESVPGLNNWRVIHTPGHAPGHISLFRDEDKTLIAGDGFVTTNQQSAFAVMTQKKQLSGPPKYFTPDWVAAEKSVRKLAELYPRVAATGHGVPMSGEELTNGLENLVNHFENIAVPDQGRYVNEPARANTRGVQYVPPKPFNPLLTASVFAFGALATYAVIKRAKKKRATKKLLKGIKKGLKLPS